MQVIRITTLVFALLLLLVGAAFAQGNGAGDAVWADGTEQTVAPNSALWTRFEYGGNKRPVKVTLDANEAPNLRLAIYTPQAVAAFHNGEELKAIGLGSPVQHHDLGWSGEFNFSGTFYAVVYNDGDAPVTVQVQATGENTRTAEFVPVPTATPLSNPFSESTPIGDGVLGRIAFLDAQGGNLYTVNGEKSVLVWTHSGITRARKLPSRGRVPCPASLPLIPMVRTSGCSTTPPTRARPIGAPTIRSSSFRVTQAQKAAAKFALVPVVSPFPPRRSGNSVS
jgi:hypothetical protein